MTGQGGVIVATMADSRTGILGAAPDALFGSQVVGAAR